MKLRTRGRQPRPGLPQRAANPGRGQCAWARASAAIAFVFLLAGACGDDLVAPDPGSIAVTARTTGDDVDEDMYEVVVDGGVRQPIGTNARVEIPAVLAGVHEVALAHVADNCQINGSQSRSISVPSGGSVEVEFQVVCAATGLEITARSTGSGIPDSYQLLIDWQRTVSVGANGSVVVGRLAAGTHTVTLSIPPHCITATARVFTVGVVNRMVTPLLLEVACVTMQRASVAGEIAYSFAAGGIGGIALLDLETSQTTTLTRGNGPAWSPDGTHFVFGDDGTLVVLDLETRSRRTVYAGGPAFEAAWAPGGDAIAFVRWNQAAPSFDRLYLLKLDGSAPVEIATPTVSVGDPSWSPDGQRIVFRCEVSSRESDICVINRDGTGFVRLTRDGSRYIDPAWSPDGSTIAACREFDWDYGWDIALMAADGSGVRTLTAGCNPAWSPDGSKLVFAGPSGDGLLMIDVDGTNLTRLTAGIHWDPAWRPTGAR